jgi:hypothetical protein
MKTLRNIFALFVLTTAMYSCDSEVTLDDPQSEKIESIETISAETGDQGSQDSDKGREG